MVLNGAVTMERCELQGEQAIGAECGRSCDALSGVESGRIGMCSDLALATGIA